MDKEAIYLVVGTLVLANIGTIVTVLISLLKFAAKFGEMNLQLQINKKDVNAAHERIRSLEKYVPPPNSRGN